jgi:hypothetical protein
MTSSVAANGSKSMSARSSVRIMYWSSLSASAGEARNWPFSVS